MLCLPVFSHLKVGDLIYNTVPGSFSGGNSSEYVIHLILHTSFKV